jgi:hypothetical protein
MRLTERSMFRLAVDLRAADLRAAEDERRRRHDDEAHAEPTTDRGRPAGATRATGLRRLMPGGARA